MSIIISILVLGFIIFIHEGGHFLFAKLFKVPVREFSIGMGKRIFSFIKGKTRYSLKLFPIGGSCAMIGEDIAGSGDFAEIDGVINTENNTISFDGVTYDIDEVTKYNFSALHPIKKLLICFGGPLFNFLLAFILSIVLVSFTGIDLPFIKEVPIDSPASMATPYPLMAGDMVTKIELPTKEKMNTPLSRYLSLYMQLYNNKITSYELPLKIEFIRNNTKYETYLNPVYDESLKKSIMGITLDYNVKSNNIFDSINYGFKEFYFYIDSTILSLKMLFNGSIPITEVSGPVGTVAIMGSSINEASSIDFMSGVLTIITLIILISANLGIMNLLPIPALDGGRIVFALAELILGKKLNPKIETFLNVFTMILLLLFMAWIFGLDIVKLFTK